ncbi:MAG: 23S rRNA (pseudouridine(1915)-N(3))-methyltransferase RlmH [Stomatobaculum sp.]|nr:23S rRNA (pseudouridine(1915)-N(3))-methyltransferase RlmH [Stomatobaculum sp.]
MNITVITVGSLKEKFWKDACAEYAKRLSAYCRLTVTEVKDEKTPEGCPPAMEEKIREKEGKRILEKLKDRGLTIVLEIRGDRFDSISFSKAHERWETEGRGDLTFIIGGSLGLSQEVLAKADRKISFSDMTFPHQLMRVILLEQLYRSYRIRNGEPYHK